MQVAKCIEGFTSPHYSQRSLATEYLFKCTDLIILNDLKAQYDPENKPEFSLALLHHLIDLAKKVDSELTPFAMTTMLEFRGHVDITKLNELISVTIKDIFLDTKVNKHYKNFLLNKIWKDLSEKNKTFLTKITVRIQLSSSARLLLQNFESSNQELLLITLKAFATFEDGRGNGFVKKLLKTGSRELQLECLRTLSRTGGFFNSSYIIPFMHNNDLELANTAVRAYRRMKKKYALPLLKKRFNETDSVGLREILIKEIARVPNLNSFEFLLTNLFSVNESKLQSFIEAEIISHGYKRRDLALIKFCEMQPKDKRLYYLELFEYFNSPASFDYLNLIIKDVQNSKLERTLCIELLSQYFGQRTFEVLDALVQGRDSYLSSIAFYTILKLNFKLRPQDIINYIPSTKDLNIIEHSMFMRYARKTKFREKEIGRVVSYFLSLVKTSNLDNRISAISSLQDIHNQNSFLELLKLYHNEYKDDVEKYFKNTILKTMRKIIYDSPEIVELRSLALVPDELFSDLDAISIEESLLERIVQFLEGNKNNLLEQFLLKNREVLVGKFAKIIETRSEESALSVFSYTHKLRLVLPESTLNYLITIVKKDSPQMSMLLRNLINTNSEKHLDFLLANIPSIKGIAKDEFLKEYLENVL